MKIFFAHLQDVRFNKNLLEKYRHFLDEEDHKRLSKITSAQVKRNFILGRFLIRDNVSKILHCKVGDVKLKKTKNGRLELDNDKLANVSFNLSHSKDFVFLAISEHKVGIDVEFKKHRDFQALSQYHFTSKESQFLHNLTPQSEIKIEDIFYSYWTLKESFVKLNGGSILDKNLNLEFLLDLNNKTVSTLKEDDYQFCTYALHNNYIMSFALLTSDSSLELLVNEVFVNDNPKKKHSLTLLFSSN